MGLVGGVFVVVLVLVYPLDGLSALVCRRALPRALPRARAPTRAKTDVQRHACQFAQVGVCMALSNAVTLFVLVIMLGYGLVRQGCLGSH